MTITGEWIDSWTLRVGEYAADFTDKFESKFGYPSDINSVEPAQESGAQEISGIEGVPQDLIVFYQRVGEVSLPDLGSGIFIHPENQTVVGIRGDLPTQIMGSREDSIVVFGSDGGGTLFALSGTDGATVYRLPPSRVEGSVYTEGGLPCTVVASSLAEFLSVIEAELKRECAA